MCNEYEQIVAWSQYCQMMQALDLGIPAEQSEADLPQSASIRISDTGRLMRVAANVVELVPMRFGLPPARPKAGPVFNWRSEGRKFDASKRGLIPASAFFEFTGTKSPKAKHRFSLKEAPFMAIAAIWREGAEGAPPSFAMLTTAPGPDIAPYHDRQVVVLPPEEWTAWLYRSKPEADLLRPLPEGSLVVETIRKEGEKTAKPR
jgi:putative SOS response-associated peptidase YedK